MVSDATDSAGAARAKLLVVGGGRMGEALTRGLLSAGWAEPTEVVVAEQSLARREELEGPEGLVGRWPGLRVVERLEPAEGVLVAVKPNEVERVCRSLGPVRPERLLSIAAGVSLASIEGWLGSASGSIAVLRAMPNIAVAVSAGASALAAGSSASPLDVAWAEGILASVGTVQSVKETDLDAVTGLSGSGPAYLFLLAEAMTDAGVLAGLSREVASRLTVQTLLGSSQLLAQAGGQAAATLRWEVTSPAGTTAAALRALEESGFRAAMLSAVVAATERSRSLGERRSGLDRRSEH